ncbi:alpha/beta fold hydrolase [Noviherbaspirillum sp. Root189]|uniref:alpha/beta fold hydrolase n=1 Tax=Noviherbaspirillum sp. Root189 TaxID=1736487 RepID=UPI00138F0099|nr:alpha/beta fold hydrolase [Noviherbaspirillum sp. Root189]
MPKPIPLSLPLPFHEGYLPVGGGHRLYFAQYGNPNAPASLVLHGGPGSGCKLSMLDWFDLSQDQVVLFDQRGAGRSLPAGATDNNQTGDLIEDIERLRMRLQLSSFLLVGGSWGAMLALCYAGRYPEAVHGLVMRGAFLATRMELDWFFQSLKALVPAAWERLTAGWNILQKRNVLQTLTVMLQSVSSEEQQDAARRWGEYEEAVLQAMMGNGPVPVDFDPRWVGKYRVQAHYISNACFTNTRSLFRCARRTAAIPAILLHGTHDWICPPCNALRLTRCMPHADLRWITRGTHTPSDPTVREALRKAIRDLRKTE